MMSQLPETSESEHPGTKALATRWLLRSRDISIIPSLIEEGNNEEQVNADDSHAKPEHVLPLVRAAHNKVAK